MKSSSKLLLFVLILISCKVYKRQGILFEPTIFSDKEYKMTLITEENSIIEYSGNQLLIDAIKEQGVEHPITSNKKTEIETKLTTGKLKGSKYSFRLNYDKVKSSHTGSIAKLNNPIKTIERLQGVGIYGWVDENKDIEIDSVINLQDETLRISIEQGMKNIMNQIEFPKETISIGESFSNKTPIKFPVGNGTVLDMTITNTYKLISISNAIAYLSINQNIEVESDIAGSDLDIEGFGKGQLEYDIINKNVERSKTEMNFNSSIKIEGFNVKSNTKNISILKTEILNK